VLAAQLLRELNLILLRLGDLRHRGGVFETTSLARRETPRESRHT
jgi:hypothetical protein